MLSFLTAYSEEKSLVTDHRIPNLLSLKSDKKSLKIVKKWSEVYDDFTIAQRFLNPLNGEIKILIPFLDVPLGAKISLKLDLTFQQLYSIGEFKIGLLNDFITIDDNAEYLFHSSEGIKSITKNYDGQFMLQDSSNDTLITFDNTAQVWTIDTPKERFVYGKHGDLGAVHRNGVYFVAEKQNKLTGKSIFYHYLTNPNILLDKITSIDLLVEFDYLQNGPHLTAMKVSTNDFHQVSK